MNDLDLELAQNGKIVLRGNAFTGGITAAGGPADPTNNVEQVIQPGPSGFYTLTVKAVTLAGDGIPANADTTDQDFALVVTNAVAYSGPILSAGTVTSADVCSGTGSGGDTVIDPGETVVFSVPLANSGDAAATAVTGSLASLTPGATVLDGSSAYADIPAGGVGNPNAGDTLSVAVSDTLSCGAGIDLVLTVSTGQGSFAVPIHFDVGSRTVTTENLAGTTGLVNDDAVNPGVFTTPAAASGTIRSVSLDVNLTSVDASYLFDDYMVTLTSPQGTGVTVHSNPIPCQALNTTFPDNRLAQVGSMDLYKGQDAGGIWTLRVYDRNNTHLQRLTARPALLPGDGQLLGPPHHPGERSGLQHLRGDGSPSGGERSGIPVAPPPQSRHLDGDRDLHLGEPGDPRRFLPSLSGHDRLPGRHRRHPLQHLPGPVRDRRFHHRLRPGRRRSLLPGGGPEGIPDRSAGRGHRSRHVSPIRQPDLPVTARKPS